jgi:hypothetical protein
VTEGEIVKVTHTTAEWTTGRKCTTVSRGIEIESSGLAKISTIAFVE